MAATLSTFKARFPEFNGTPDTLIQACLDDAASTHHSPTWPVESVRDLAILYKAAALLSLSPGARCLRLDPKNPDTIYDKRWRELARSVYGGPRAL